MNSATIRSRLGGLGRLLPAAMLLAAIGVPGWTSTAQARFTCTSNAECAEVVDRCEPGGCDSDRNECNEGVCNPDSPGADAIGCIIVPNDSKCDDGLFCNGAERCDYHRGCQDNPLPPNCDDGILCTVDSCDEVNDTCKHVKKNSFCNNGLFCDGVEQCDVNEGCKPGTAPNCNDGVSCTVDSCNESADRCDNIPDNGLCSDGQFCDGVEICDPSAGCVEGSPPNCNDNVPCTVDSCNEAADRCDNVPSNELCSNGQFCDGVETCSPTQGCQAGTAPNCNDGIPCTQDSCNETLDTCLNVPNNAVCNNGKFCDGDEVCSPTQGCRPGNPVNCSDGVGCTADSCNELQDRCDHVVQNFACNDNQFCNGVETCDPVEDCVAGTPPDCDDGVDCTADACSNQLRACTHTARDAACSNGLYCDGLEHCEPLLGGCFPGFPPVCVDQTDCTIDSCDEEADACSFEPDNSVCDNGQFCDGAESCDPDDGCVSGDAPDCDDQIHCTRDLCNEAGDVCTHEERDALCNDGKFCNGLEICSELLGCLPGPPPDCTDNHTCTDDSCSDAQGKCLNEPNNSSCGDGIIDTACGEECDAAAGEICNNEIDDDLDGLVDCADPDCSEAQQPCGDMCILLPPCVPLLEDPAVIAFPGGERSTDRPGRFSLHARMVPTTPVHPPTDPFVLTLSNANGEIFRAELDPALLRTKGSKRFFYKTRDTAEAMRKGGVAKLSIRQRKDAGELGYGFRVVAYGDFSKATLARMTTQVYLGDDIGFLTATWSGEVGRWILRPRDYDQ